MPDTHLHDRSTCAPPCCRHVSSRKATAFACSGGGRTPSTSRTPMIYSRSTRRFTVLLCFSIFHCLPAGSCGVVALRRPHFTLHVIAAGREVFHSKSRFCEQTPPLRRNPRSSKRRPSQLLNIITTTPSPSHRLTSRCHTPNSTALGLLLITVNICSVTAVVDPSHRHRPYSMRSAPLSNRRSAPPPISS